MDLSCLNRDLVSSSDAILEGSCPKIGAETTYILESSLISGCASSKSQSFSKQECSLITSDILKNSLYGKWSLWNGKPPPSDVQEGVLRNLPPELLRCTPSQLKYGISSLPGCSVGVFAKEWIRDGTDMGPLPGKAVNKMTRLLETAGDCCAIWEVLDEYGGVKHILDGREFWTTSWMAHVKCARNEQEQNLEVLQLGDIIYYKAIKNIAPDEELLVWYSNDIPQYMGLPEAILPKDSPDCSPENKLKDGATRSHSAMQPSSNGRLKCLVCRRGFNSRSNLRSHMRIHTMERPFVCKFCQRSFSQSSTLRNHIRLHTGERPYKCVVCQSAYSQLAGLRAHQKSAKHRLPAAGAAITQTISQSQAHKES